MDKTCTFHELWLNTEPMFCDNPKAYGKILLDFCRGNQFHANKPILLQSDVIVIVPPLYTERHKALMRILCAEWCALSNNESRRAGPQRLCASHAQNDALEATLSHSTQAQRSGVHIEVQRTKERDFNAWCIKSVWQFIEPFVLTIVNVSYCACEEPFIVLSTTVLWSNRHPVESYTI